MADTPTDRTRNALDRIEEALRGLRYGTVTAVVQDGVIVQIERMEKLRLAGRQPGALFTAGPEVRSREGSS